MDPDEARAVADALVGELIAARALYAALMERHVCKRHASEEYPVTGCEMCASSAAAEAALDMAGDAYEAARCRKIVLPAHPKATDAELMLAIVCDTIEGEYGHLAPLTSGHPELAAWWEGHRAMPELAAWWAERRAAQRHEAG